MSITKYQLRAELEKNPPTPNAKIDLWAGIRVRTPNSKADIHLQGDDTYSLTGDRDLHPAIAERLAEYGLKEKTWNH